MKEPNSKVYQYLKTIYENTKAWKFSPADLYMGAHSALISKEKNPDWMAQSAHSIREITYLLKQQKGAPEKRVLVKMAFEAFVEGVVGDSETADFILLEETVSKIAHHGSLKSVCDKLSEKGIEVDADGKVTEEQYIKILELTDSVFLSVLPVQVSAHQEIEKILKEVPDDSLLFKVRYLISINGDTRDFFFENVDSNWVKWLHKNVFFALLNTPAVDKNAYGYRTPELGYLERAVKEKPDEVTKIMLEVNPLENYNPEVIDRFTRITESLTGENLTKIVQKIHDDNWIQLMSKFNTWGHTYEDIVKQLVAEGNVDSLLQLADVIMSVRDERDEVRSNPFVLSNISDISILESLASLQGDYAVKAYHFVISKLAEVIGEGVKEDVFTQVFRIEEPYYFFDVDLFNHDFGEKHSRSYRDDLENLMAAIVLITRNVFAVGCGQEEKLKSIYKHLDSTMPDSWSGWRLRLFTASFCGELFREELQTMFNRLFVVMKGGKPYHEIESGTEYKKALRVSWPELGYDFKQKYIEDIFEYFNPKKTEDEEQAKYRSRDAVEILKMIETDVNDAQVKEVFGLSLQDKRIGEPQPRIGKVVSGSVVDRSPVDIANFAVSELPQLLKTDLRPEEIEKKYKNDPFHNPRNVEGVGAELRRDVQEPERLNEYLDHIAGFFAPTEIHRHYTYSVLQGIENVLRDKKTFAENQWKKLFTLIEVIESVKLTEPVDEKQSFLVSWKAVRRTNADILKYTLDKDFLSEKTFSEYRKRILSVLESLLYSDDPKPEHETGEYGDLLTVAINHTRGVAYQAFIQFLYKDGENLQDDTKKVLLNLFGSNDSLSTWSIIGQYLPSVYFRDPSWVEDQLPNIFTVDDKEQFFAAWEGYVTTSVYHELYDVMEEYYLYALNVKESDYPERSDRGRDLDQAIGTHLALAYTHFDEVSLESLLVEKLWENKDAKKQGEFISHLGRGFISNNLIKPDVSQIKKIIKLWDWILEKDKGEIAPEAYGEFGLWIRDKGVEDIVDNQELAKRFAKLLELSGGRLDYEYHLKDKLVDLATVDAESTLSIMRSLLLSEESETSRNIWMRSDTASVEVFAVLYKAEPEDTAYLINELIEKKGRVFWGLKSVLS